jgi:hypothetical protein
VLPTRRASLPPCAERGSGEGGFSRTDVPASCPWSFSSWASRRSRHQSEPGFVRAARSLLASPGDHWLERRCGGCYDWRQCAPSHHAWCDVGAPADRSSSCQPVDHLHKRRRVCTVLPDAGTARYRACTHLELERLAGKEHGLGLGRKADQARLVLVGLLGVGGPQGLS